MKRVLLLFLLSLFVSNSFGQSFGEIQKIESVGKTLTPNGPMPLVNTSFDISGNYVFTYNQLIPRKGKTSFWEQVNEFTLDISEVAFVNWNAGGTNSISGMYGMNVVRIYRNKGFRWDNQFRFRYGINQQEGQELIKTDDDLEFISSFGYEVSKNSNWFYSGKLSYKTQASRGFNYPDTEVSISEFMTPGYIFLGIGAKYAQLDESFELYLSPITQKSTFVLNQRLANEGAFGVRSAVRDSGGNIIREGENSRNEFGILVTNEFEQKIFESAVVVNRISLYSDYINNFGNVDIDWELIINFKINNFMRASIGAHIRYDDDIKIREEAPDGTMVDGGSRIQLKQQLGIGIALQL